MAQLPDHGITVSKVAETLGVTSTDVGKLCICNTTNKFSKWKPVRYNTQTGITADQLKSVEYGLQIPRSAENPSAQIIPSSILTDWVYLQPQGGASSPYRLGDYRNYLHEAVPPVFSTYSKYHGEPKHVQWKTTAESSNKIRLNLQLGSAEDEGMSNYNLKMKDFSFGLTTAQANHDCHLMAYIYQGHFDPYNGDTLPSSADKVLINPVEISPTSGDYSKSIYFQFSTAFMENGISGQEQLYEKDLTVIFAIGLGLTRTISNGNVRYVPNDGSYSTSQATKYPPYVIGMPYNDYQYPVVWIDKYVKPVANIEFVLDDSFYYRNITDSTAKWKTVNTSGTYYDALGGAFWRSTEETINLPGGNEAQGSNNRMYVSFMLNNIGTASKTFNLTDLRYRVKTISGTIDTNLELINYNENFTTNSTTSYTIAAGANQRLFLRLSGFYCPVGSKVSCDFYISGQDEPIGHFEFYGTNS